MMLRSLILFLLILPTFAAENIKAVGAVSKANVKAIGAVAEANVKAFGVVDNTGGGGGGGAAFDSVSTNSYTVAAQTTITNAHTFTGSARAAIVFAFVYGGDPDTFTTIDAGGTAGTELFDVELDGGVDIRMSGFVIINPPSGSQNVIATLNGNPNAAYLGMHVISATGINQGGGEGVSWRPPATDGGGGGDPISIAITGLTAGDFVASAIGNYGDPPTSPSHTSRGIMDGIESSPYDQAAQSTTAAGTSVTFTWSGGIGFWTGGAIALIPQ